MILPLSLLLISQENEVTAPVLIRKPLCHKWTLLLHLYSITGLFTLFSVQVRTQTSGFNNIQLTYIVGRMQFCCTDISCMTFKSFSVI